MPFELRLFHDALEPRAGALALAPVAARALYVVDGAVALRAPPDGRTIATVGTNSGVSAAAAGFIATGSQGASLLRWELVESGAEPAVAQSVAPPGVASTELLRAKMPLDRLQDYLLRCDRVDFPPEGEALTHTHQGGGIRCLLSGGIRIETLGHATHYGPLKAWFEAGPEPVYAATDAGGPSAFVRVMILPKALLGGQSSIRYVRQEDLERPKNQRYQIFIDEPLGGAP